MRSSGEVAFERSLLQQRLHASLGAHPVHISGNRMFTRLHPEYQPHALCLPTRLRRPSTSFHYLPTFYLGDFAPFKHLDICLPTLSTP